jgi:cyclohexanecarboxylate-CoA ligase
VHASRLTPNMVEHFTSSGMWGTTLMDDHVATAAREFPDRVAVVDRNRSQTFAEVEALVSRAAAMLQRLGVQPGETVSWQLPNWLEAIVLHHAIIRIGAVSNPIVAIYRAREVGFILKQSKAGVYICPSVFRGFDYPAMVTKLRHDLPDLRHLVVVGGGGDAGTLSFEQLMAEAGTPAPVPRTADDIVLLLYTSGTTADPKGALHTHNTLGYENRSIIELFEATPSDTIFMPSPLTHITGLLYGVQMPFIVKAPVVLQDVWDVDRALALIDEHNCTWCVGATPFLHGLVSRSADGKSSLRVFACGGADVPPDLIRAASSRLGAFVTRVYGSTEYPTALSSAPGDPLEKCAGTDGRPIADAQVRIALADGQPAGVGVEGELQVRGPELFVGYLDDRLNADSFTDDGWFRTGDLAQQDAEGYVQITGRMKDIILRGGENISAKEVEDLIFEHPKVSEAAVVAKPDPVMVERVCAFVVPMPGEDVDLPEIVAFLRQRGIANQKLPEFLVTVDELPRTPSGKIQKFRLRDRLRQDAPA